MNKIIIPGKPVSVNDLYTGKRFLTKDGKTMKTAMSWEVRNQWKRAMISRDVIVHIDLYYSDKRKRDIDNPAKALLDSLTGVVFDDDSQVVDLHITKNIGPDRAEIIIYERDKRGI